jgi:hypothetical protein
MWRMRKDIVMRLMISLVAVASLGLLAACGEKAQDSAAQAADDAAASSADAREDAAEAAENARDDADEAMAPATDSAASAMAAGSEAMGGVANDAKDDDAGDDAAPPKP